MDTGENDSASASSASCSVSRLDTPVEDSNGELSMSQSDVSIHKESLWSQEEAPQVVMCVVWGGGKLGLSYYEVDMAILHIMPDVAESQDFGLLTRVLLQLQPRVVVISSKTDDRMQKILQDYAKPQNNSFDSDTTSATVTVEVLPSSDFRLEPCQRRVTTTSNLPGVPEECSDEERLIRIASLIPLESVNMVRSLGVLLKYVDKKRLGVELEEAGTRVPVLAIRTFSLDSLMVMDESSYCALQIFQKELHPSVYKAGKGAKEGLSLFGIVNKTKSLLGSRLLKLWFLRPLQDLAALKRRQDAVAFLCSPRNEEMASTLHDCVKHIKNLPRILTRMNAAQATMNDWNAIYKTIYNGIYIADICRSLPQDIAIFKKMAEAFTEDLNRLASIINKIVDFSESSSNQRFCVKPNVDSELDAKKSVFAGLPDVMSRVAREEMGKLNNCVSECSVLYLPQLGYMLTVPRSEVEGKEQEMAKRFDLDFMFMSTNQAHFKSAKTLELDAILGDTQCEIQDHETAIMHQLQGVVLERAGVLITVMELAAELDCLISLALFAREHNSVRPELTEDSVTYIKAGRHPLQELCVSPFVPNDTCLDLEHGRMKILTGPNASGKSVYLKQVGLLVFLAHIGSFLPAEGAKVGLVDQLFTRIQTRESVSVALSTFMIDLSQVSIALRESTGKSLIILDEFGKGTATVDGLSLLAASLRHWLSQGPQCPSVLVSTHFHSVIQQRLLPNSQLVEYLTMDCLRDGEELVFLYQLVRGQTDTSYACHVAAMMGLPQELVERGAKVSDLIRRNEPVTRVDAVGMEAQRKRCASIVSRFLELDLDSSDVALFFKEFVIPTAEGVL